jgi:hypothetical protein
MEGGGVAAGVLPRRDALRNNASRFKFALFTDGRERP